MAHLLELQLINPPVSSAFGAALQRLCSRHQLSAAETKSSTATYESRPFSVFTVVFPFAQITVDNCVEVEHMAADLHLEDVQGNIGDPSETERLQV